MQWTRPKSVRQIGEIPGRGRIYMEDYVIRFVKRLAEQSHGMEKAAVLLGASLICDGEKIYQISGVVEIHNFAGRSGPKFTDEDWDYIYSEMKEICFRLRGLRKGKAVFPGQFCSAKRFVFAGTGFCVIFGF